MNLQSQCKEKNCPGWNNPMICIKIKPCPLDIKKEEERSESTIN